jgi:hypothetical protein
MSTKKATEFFDLVWDIISDAFKYSNHNCSNISPETSLEDFFHKVSGKGISEEDQTTSGLQSTALNPRVDPLGGSTK